ncbi:MAG: TRAP transporter small permease subunit [Lautropia sp.]|nr:TRAP transporter small permease subunit [Lautropia sp.]
MRALAQYVSFISALNGLLGRIFSWLALAIVLVCFTVVVQRYLFSTSQIWMQDLYVWLSGAMFMAMSAPALARDQHVRVDIFYRRASLRQKAWRDLFGVLLCLLPFCTVVWLYAWPYVLRAWKLQEGSPNAGGMPGFFVLKAFILVFVVTTALQGLAMLARSVLVLAGRESLLPPHLRYQQEGN